MADKPVSVERAENYLGILALANDYANGKEIKGLDIFLGRTVRGKTKILSQRMENRPSKMLSDAVRGNIERAQKVIDAYDSNANKPVSNQVPIMASSNEVTPEDAAKVDGDIIKEVPALQKVASDIDPKKLMDSREGDRVEDEISKRKILPGNMHTEMSRMLGGTQQVKEASLDEDDAAKLSGLYR